MKIETALLKTIDFFSDAPNAFLEKIAHIARVENYAAGQTLLEQGKPQDKIYMVADGKLSLSSRLADGREIALDEVAQGSSIGTSALCEDTAPQFSVVCAQNCTLIVISIKDALELFSKDYDTGYHMMLVMVDRFRREADNRTRQFLRSLKNYPGIYSTLS